MKKVFIISFVVITIVVFVAAGHAKEGKGKPHTVVSQCNDGIDNDNDNKIDYAGIYQGKGKNKVLVSEPDPDCSSKQDDNEAAVTCIPSKEICDSIDNDCDGLIDEDLTLLCGIGNVGECKYGTQTCSNGYYGSCEGSVYPGTEICGNGLDENCDGSIDEGCTTTETCYQGMSLPADFKAFSDNSPWNTLIPENPDLHPYSDDMMQNLSQSIYGAHLRRNRLNWTWPIHVIDSRFCDRVTVVHYKEDRFHPYFDPDAVGVIELPIPPEAWPDPQDDGHMVIIDPLANISWEFSRAEKIDDTLWRVSGMVIWDLDGPGYKEELWEKYWWMFGANGAGAALSACAVRPEEITAGVINHALCGSTPINRASLTESSRMQVAHPLAVKTDGDGIGNEYIPMGMRLQLDPGLDLDALGLSYDMKVVAKALQDYGLYVVMSTHDDFIIYFQNVGPNGWDSYDLSGYLYPADFRVLEGNVVTRP